MKLSVPTMMSLLLLACGDPQSGATTTGTTGDGATGTTGVPTTSTAVPTTSTGGPDLSTTDDNAGVDASGDGLTLFIQPDGSVKWTCDLFAQDCPEGEKCTIWSSEGDWWDAYKCVPVVGDAQPGEPCTAQDSAFSGLDDCEKGALCWDVDAALHGACIALCTGPEYDPTCPENFSCSISDEGVVLVCLQDCDLLLQDCPGDELCIPIDDGARCVLDASGAAGAAFDPCEYMNSCDPGLLCAWPTSAVECDPNAEGCCTPMCDLGAMNTCPGVGQSCASLYEEGQAPPNHAEVGYCTVP